MLFFALMGWMLLLLGSLINHNLHKFWHTHINKIENIFIAWIINDCCQIWVDFFLYVTYLSNYHLYIIIEEPHLLGKQRVGSSDEWLLHATIDQCTLGTYGICMCMWAHSPLACGNSALTALFTTIKCTGNEECYLLIVQDGL